MPVQLTFVDGKYEVPDEWVTWEWITKIENYPDPNHRVFEHEYDWDFRDKQGVLGRYIRKIDGSTSQRTSKTGNLFDVTYAPSPYIYYLFSLAAVELIENPHLYREAHEGKLNGSFVVQYANKIGVSSHDWLPEKEGRRKTHVISDSYGPLLARVFNACSGVRSDDELRVEPREPKRCKCPNPKCRAIFQQLTKSFWLPGEKGYDEEELAMVVGLAYRKDRDDNG